MPPDSIGAAPAYDPTIWRLKTFHDAVPNFLDE